MAKEEKKSAPKEAESFKYGVDDLADALGIKPASARVALRKHDIEKAGKSYGWNSKAELETVIATIEGDKKTEKKSEKKETKKPAAKAEKKADAKAPAKKVEKKAAA